MMAEKARLLKDHHAVELIMSSPDPSTHKHIIGVRNFDSAVWDRETQNAVLSGNCTKFTHIPDMKHHRLSTANKRLAEASPLDPVWGVGLRTDDPRANNPRQWRRRNLLGEALSAVCEENHDDEAGLVQPSFAGQFRTSTGKAGIHEISSAPPSCSLTAASARQGPPSEVSTYPSNPSADQPQDVLEIASGVGPGLALSSYGPCLVGGTMTLDDVSFTTKFAIHNGGDVTQVRGAPRYWFPPIPSTDVTSCIVCFW